MNLPNHFLINLLDSVQIDGIFNYIQDLIEKHFFNEFYKKFDIPHTLRVCWIIVVMK